MASTTLTSWALLLWNTLKSKGYDPRPVFLKSELDPAKLGDGQARYDAHKMRILWEEAVKLTDDENIGVEVGKSWCPTTFHALGFAWLASDSLYEGLQRLVRYSHLVNNSLITRVERFGTNYRLWISTTEDLALVHPAGNDAGLCAVIKMCRMLVGEHFTPVAFETIRPYRSVSTLEAYIGRTPEYGKEGNAFIIESKVAEKTLATGNPSLVEANERVAREYLIQVEKDDIVGNVINSIIEMLPAGNTSEERIAQKLHLTSRTMQRKLKQEGQSFKKLLNETRENLANNHIKNSSLSLTEIAYLLGFSDQANFTRAYKRWTGLAPSAHRKALFEKLSA